MNLIKYIKNNYIIILSIFFTVLNLYFLTIQIKYSILQYKLYKEAENNYKIQLKKSIKLSNEYRRIKKSYKYMETNR